MSRGASDLIATTSSIGDEQLLYTSLFLLTFVTGLVEAASFLGLGHVFTAYMTGNILFLAFSLAGAPNLSLLRSCTALMSAIMGSILAGHLDRRYAWRKRNQWLASCFALEAVLLALAAVSATRMAHASGGLEHRIYMVIGLTALAMGLRNGTVRRLGIADFTTTFLTTTLTSLGFDSPLAGGSSLRWPHRVGSLISMFTGAVAGVFLLRLSLSAVLMTAAALTGVSVLLQLMRNEVTQELKPTSCLAQSQTREHVS